MNMAEVMGTTGMYKEALEQLGQIDKKTLSDYLYPYYYHLYRTIYGLMGDYAVTEKEKKEYYRMTDLYRDSLLQTNASDSLGHVLVMADKCTVHAQYDQAITMLTDFYRKPSLDDHSKAMITYTLSEAYRLKGDKKGQKHFLALSAIADLKSAVKEYVSLRKLASLVYEDGDIDRAYNYLQCPPSYPGNLTSLPHHRSGLPTENQAAATGNEDIFDLYQSAFRLSAGGYILRLQADEESGCRPSGSD